MALPIPPVFPAWVYPRVGTPWIVTTLAEFRTLDPAKVANTPAYWLGWREGFDAIRAAQTPDGVVPDLPVPAVAAVSPSEAPARRGPGRPRKDA